MYAIIEDSGTQIKVAPGDVVDLDLRALDEGASTVRLEHVLLVASGEGDGGSVTVGQPYVEGALVTAEVVGEIRGEKLRGVMYKRRKGSRRRMGHRQSFLRVKISQIQA